MLCYKDQTFCKFYKDCTNAADCSRPLTPEVQQAADDFGLPIAQWVEQPKCHSNDNDGAAQL